MDTVSKVNFLITSITADYMNATKKYRFAETWGYTKGNSTVFNGLVGDLQRRVGDVGGNLKKTT